MHTRSMLLAQLLIFAAFISAASLNADARTPSEKPAVKTTQTGSSEIVIIGASYAKDWPVQQLAGRPVVNRGIGGQESHDIHARFEKDVVAQRPSAVIIWGFINDIFRAAPEALPTKKEAIKKNITEMVELARRNGVRPILATEVTMRGKRSATDTVMGWIGKLLGKRSYADNINGHVLEVNDWMRQYANANGVPLLDLQSVLAESSGLRKKEYTKDDGSHLTPAAYDALTNYVDPALSRALTMASSDRTATSK